MKSDLVTRIGNGVGKTIEEISNVRIRGQGRGGVVSAGLMYRETQFEFPGSCLSPCVLSHHPVTRNNSNSVAVSSAAAAATTVHFQNAPPAITAATPVATLVDRLIRQPFVTERLGHCSASCFIMQQCILFSYSLHLCPFRPLACSIYTIPPSVALTPIPLLCSHTPTHTQTYACTIYT